MAIHQKKLWKGNQRVDGEWWSTIHQMIVWSADDEHTFIFRKHWIIFWFDLRTSSPLKWTSARPEFFAFFLLLPLWSIERADTHSHTISTRPWNGFFKTKTKKMFLHNSHACFHFSLRQRPATSSSNKCCGWIWNEIEILTSNHIWIAVITGVCWLHRPPIVLLTPATSNVVLHIDASSRSSSHVVN